MILAFAAVSPFALIALWPVAPLAGIGVLMLSHALILYPTLLPNVQWLGPVVTRFRTDARELWLTIDDGPADDTAALLDLFDVHGVKATFFVKGLLVAARPEIARTIVARGHTAANHSHTHPSGTFWCLFPRSIALEVERCQQALEAAGAAPPPWFRAPVGHKNPAVHPVLARRGMRLIGWSVRGFDGVKSEPAEVVARILRGLEPGAILVLHQGRPESVRVLESVIVAAKERGYSFVVPADAQLLTA